MDKRPTPIDPKFNFIGNGVLWAIVIIALILTMANTNRTSKLSPASSSNWQFFTSVASHVTAVSCYNGFQKCEFIGNALESNLNSAPVAYYSNNLLSLVPVNLPSSVAQFGSGIICVNSSICYAAGSLTTGFLPVYSVFKFENQSISSVMNIPSWGDLAGLDCVTALKCIAVTTVSSNAIGVYTNDGWSTSSPFSIGSEIQYQVPYSVTCSQVLCIYPAFESGQPTVYNSGGNAFELSVSPNFGQSWQQIDLPSIIGEISNISCNNKNLCVFVGADMYSQPLIGTSTDGGYNWTIQYSTQIGSFTSVSCMNNYLTCAVGGSTINDQPFVMITENGSSWYQESLPNPHNDEIVTNVYCATNNECIVILTNQDDNDSTILYSTQDAGYQTSDPQVTLENISNEPAPQILSTQGAVEVGDSTLISFGVGLIVDGGLVGVSLYVPPNAANLEFGCGFFTRPNCAYQLESEVDNENYPLIILQLGTADIKYDSMVIDKKTYYPGSPVYDSNFAIQYNEALQAFKSHHKKVIIDTLMYIEEYGLNNQTLPGSNPRYYDHINALIKQIASRYSNATVCDINSFLYPGGRFNYVVHGIILKPDTVHFDLLGALYLSQFFRNCVQQAYS
jgi:hypothetical protein